MLALSPLSYPDLVRRLRSLRPNTQPQWGVMSTHGMLCHLSDSFLGCMGERPISPDTNAVKRTLIKWFAIYLPMPWPKGVPTRPEVKQGDGGTPPVEFEADRERVIHLLDRILASPRDFNWCEHPIFGKMTETQWMRWCFLHVDHHLRQFGV